MLFPTKCRYLKLEDTNVTFVYLWKLSRKDMPTDRSIFLPNGCIMSFQLLFDATVLDKKCDI